ncbi:transporter substrate-binding domain-containing protein [Chromobacterium alkanivorans]|uniref:substrate-binding periplasmic protein n=1 Tax=Chromobacterium alkanivorans TaxID=1071719 RepID=UPI001967159A|nr:transporter substrate-binding domain-containing protein [Chromobacterium alkanivorans]MBN3006522.1 transporter substrate-binding domain-containing protein [Chromobacterium alkanivorans]
MSKYLPALLCLCAAAAHAASAPPACPAEGLKVGYYPTATAYENGKGYDVDLVHELARRLGCKIREEREYPRLRVLLLVQHGKLNLATSTIPLQKRLRYAWVLPYTRDRNMTLLSPAVQGKTPEQWLNDPKLKWGAVIGYRNSPLQDYFLQQMAKRDKLICAANEEDLLDMLRSGSISAAFSQPQVYDHWVSGQPRARLQVKVMDPFGDSSLENGLVLSHRGFSEPQMRLWRAELEKMRADGSLQRILRKYLSEDSVRGMLE